MIALKRVELIIEILKLIKLDVEWVHFGDGILLEDIKEKAKELPDNIESVFMGRKPNGNLLSYYQSTGVDLFINLSETEGLPVSIMEAISFGIPVIATDVGGTSEIVCNQTGWLINKEFTSSLVVSIIEENKEKYRTKEFRENIREYWKGNFRASKNYTDFYHNLAKKWGEK
jgi:glycosyltransferase involved in cell wall biosynthesis